ncbi:hypothetical protein WR25_22728 [Diploscapter pachys]|uniref:Nematode cuticle collagen N-terminal domain-containing protein n=1 Tax=Diploscapter pachys TaxID=2018661 RepID=A0A2A2KUY4_9BILA|nr:hypothetical protein WR25_22728 [Diploscapter pachys]
MKAVVCFGAACGLCSVLACLWAGLVILNDINETVSDETWGSMMAIKTLRDNGENYNYARSIFGRQKRSNAECTCGPPRGNCPQGLLKQYRYQLEILILSILCDNGIDGTPGKPGPPGEDIPIEEDFPKGCIKCPPGPVVFFTLSVVFHTYLKNFREKREDPVKPACLDPQERKERVDCPEKWALKASPAYVDSLEMMELLERKDQMEKLEHQAAMEIP